MTALAPVLDPEAWVRAIQKFPEELIPIGVGILVLWIILRYWPWRKRNGN